MNIWLSIANWFFLVSALDWIWIAKSTFHLKFIQSGEMKHAIIFYLVVLLVEAHFGDEDFPMECYSRKNGAVHLQFSCAADRFSTTSRCLKPIQYNDSNVEWIRYKCLNIFESITSLTLYLDVLKTLENLNVFWFWNQKQKHLKHRATSLLTFKIHFWFICHI